MKTLVVVVNYKTYDLLDTFLKSYQQYVDQENRYLVVVDVEAENLSKQYTKDYPISSWISHEKNVGYAYAVNDAVSKFSDEDFEVIAIFNADTAFQDEDCFNSCESLLADPSIAVVGPRQVNSGGKITHAGIIGTNAKPALRGWLERGKTKYTSVEDVVSVSGSAYFMQRSVWEELRDCPLFRAVAPDATGAFLPTIHYYEETYCSYHARQHGYRVVYNGAATMIHEWHKSSPINGERDTKYTKLSRQYFRVACANHGMECD